jgi:hypothetical protein
MKMLRAILGFMAGAAIGWTIQNRHRSDQQQQARRAQESLDRMNQNAKRWGF